MIRAIDPSKPTSWKFWGNSSEYESNCLSPDQVKKLIENIVGQKGKKIDVVSYAKALNFEGVDKKLLLEKIHRSAGEAKFFAPLTKSLDYRAKISSWINTFLVALERFLTKLGLIHLFKPMVSPEEADAKGQDMILLSTIFSTLTSTLVPLLGPLQGGMVIGGCMLTLLGLGVTYPLWRPFPSCLPQVENWTEQHRAEPFSLAVRKELLDQIVSALSSSEIDHLQPLLVGKLGVGKTELIKVLTSAIEEGQYPDLAGFQVFYMNTANLHNPTDWVPSAHSTLSYYDEAIDGKRNKIIFAFDQIDMACETTWRSSIANQFNTLLDSPKKHFPHVIGITSEESYKQFSKTNPTFAQKFRPIHVPETSQNETVEILMRARLKHSPETLAVPSMEEMLIKKTKQAFGQNAIMPKLALRILAGCIQKCSKNQKIHAPSLFEQRLELLQLRQEQMALAAKMGAHGEELEQKTFLVVSQMLLPALEEKLLAEAKEKGVNLKIDEEIIDLVISEEQARLKNLC